MEPTRIRGAARGIEAGRCQTERRKSFGKSAVLENVLRANFADALVLRRGLEKITAAAPSRRGGRIRKP
jgi:hypothetical protein